MRIGFDAKRAFFNFSGLGNYSRSIIAGLSQCFPENKYFLYSPKPSRSVPFYASDNVYIKGPNSAFDTILPLIWRSIGIVKQLANDEIDIYHGLSNELPLGIGRKIPSVVTIHDLIFIHHPDLYKRIDCSIYTKKLFHAVNNASKIIATSNQTKLDIMAHCKVSDQKIEVAYQCCNDLFWKECDSGQKSKIVEKYKIPSEFILNVGTIERRKNIFNVIRALNEKSIEIPLVVIGRQTPYVDVIKKYIDQYQMRNIFFLNNVPLQDLPSFYQQARLFIYPSLFEGFGIPILEALVSKTPVITTRGGCFSEVGGSNSMYVDPENIDEIGEKIKMLLKDDMLCDEMRRSGFIHAQKFKSQNFAKEIMEIYKSVIR